MNLALHFKDQILWFVLMVMITVISSCSKQEEPIDPFAFPDFVSCKCSSIYNPICGEDGRNYLNSCFADCKKIKIKSDSLCTIQHFIAKDTMTWPIVNVCIPVQTIDDPIEVKYFSDFTVLYKKKDGSYFRGTQNLCRCLPPDVHISTPAGEVKVSNLHVGDLVFTLDKKGKKHIVPILSIINVSVGLDHIIANVLLENGKILKCSPMHPDALGRQIGSLVPGDCIDGFMIDSIMMIPYHEDSTWDILPAGETGHYYANGILIGSTLVNTKL